jgi:hypothetical protein
LGRAVLTLTLALLSACGSTPPLAREEITDPDLAAIRRAFEDTVRSAREDPDVNWRSGWLGNVGILIGGDGERGLCYEWQGLVYGGVLGTVRCVGWEATGISINRRTASEHHAVVVWDPDRIAREALLEASPEAPAYVLDAWKRGEADVYRLADWLDLPLLVRVAPRLEEPYPGR